MATATCEVKDTTGTGKPKFTSQLCIGGSPGYSASDGEISNPTATNASQYGSNENQTRALIGKIATLTIGTDYPSGRYVKLICWANSNDGYQVQAGGRLSVIRITPLAGGIEQ